MRGMLDAAELKVLAICALVAGAILLAPGERVSAGVAFALGAALFGRHRALLRREEASGREARSG